MFSGFCYRKYFKFCVECHAGDFSFPISPSLIWHPCYCFEGRRTSEGLLRPPFNSSLKRRSKDKD